MIIRLLNRFILWAGIPLLRLVQKWVVDYPTLRQDIAQILEEYDQKRGKDAQEIKG